MNTARNQASSKNRPDWCAVVFALALPSLVTLVYFVWAAESVGRVQQIAFAIAKPIQFLFPIVWVLAIQHRRPQWYGGDQRSMLLAVGFGLIVAITALLFYRHVLQSMAFFQAPADAIRQKILGLEIDRAWEFAAFGGFYVVFHSLLEEYYWRWFVFGQLDRLVSTPLAIVVSSFGFMAHHVIVLGWFFGWSSPATWIFSLSVAVGGAVWAWAYKKSGSLIGPWMSHAFVDAAIFLIGYDLVCSSFVG